jgi:hypothetical protein
MNILEDIINYAARNQDHKGSEYLLKALASYASPVKSTSIHDFHELTVDERNMFLELLQYKLSDAFNPEHLSHAYERALELLHGAEWSNIPLAGQSTA